jgi:hypothetical protein
MLICNKCKKETQNDNFVSTTGRILKTCLNCREKCKIWKDKNKNVISLYNKNYNNNNNTIQTKTIIYAKKLVSDEDWIKFYSQNEAAKTLGLHTSNISKVINGSLKTTGGYIFKKNNEEHINTQNNKSWEEIKVENNIINKCKGQPSKHRILHEIYNDTPGKKCCKCKKWKPLLMYNYSKTHWDNLRNECKECLTEWRKENRKILNEKTKQYEKKRKEIDPEFKLIKTLRSRLGNAIRRQNSNKTDTTINLLGCSVSFLKKFLETKFTDGMSWDNHGKWHIDHIKPCALFNLLDEEEQKKCFHYTNLQPLWATDNLIKGCKYIDDNI